MVKVFEGSLTDTAPISLAQFVEFARAQTCLDDYSTLEAIGPRLRAFAANTEFFQDHMRHEFGKVLAADRSNRDFYGANTMTIFEDERFMLRFNFWLPERDFSPGIEKFFAYDLAHDHNFDFLTVGCFGPGYRTSLYQYDRTSVQGLPGEATDLQFIGEERLSPGKVMLFHRGLDVHTQWAPEDLSGSLNFVVRIPKGRLERQYMFDLVNRKVITTVNLNYREFVLNAASLLGDEHSLELAQNMASNALCERTRLAAEKASRSLRKRLLPVGKSNEEKDRGMNCL